MPSSAGAVADALFKRMMEDPHNSQCFECGAKMPQWASGGVGMVRAGC